MLNTLAKNIIIRGVKIRIANGEAVEDILRTYVKLSEDDKQEILKTVTASK